MFSKRMGEKRREGQEGKGEQGREGGEMGGLDGVCRREGGKEGLLKESHVLNYCTGWSDATQSCEIRPPSGFGQAPLVCGECPCPLTLWLYVCVCVYCLSLFAAKPFAQC